jgi:hypothetical protein
MNKTGRILLNGALVTGGIVLMIKGMKGIADATLDIPSRAPKIIISVTKPAEEAFSEASES